MNSYKHEKTHNYIYKRRSYVDVKKYMITKDENGQKYALFQLVNNYHDTLKKIVVEVKQYDANKNLIVDMEIPYDSLLIKSHCKFVPYFKLMIDKSTEKIETKVKEAYFEDHTFINGILKRNKKAKKVVEENKKVDKVVKTVNVLHTDFPRKAFLWMSGIVMCIVALFIGFFALNNNIQVENNFAIDITTGTITDYYGNSSYLTVPKTVSNVEVKRIGNHAFHSSSFENISIESDVIEIADNAFLFCPKLTYFKANEVTNIGKNAFQNCINLEVIEANITGVIGEGAFQNCSSLTNFNSTETLRIERYAFKDCSSLESVETPNTKYDIMVFSNCFNLKEVTIGSVMNLQEATLKRIFSNEIHYEDTTVNLNMDYVNKYFIDDFKFKEINFINPKVQIEKVALNSLITKAKEQGSYTRNSTYERVFDTIIDFYPENIGDTLNLTDDSIRGILLSAIEKVGGNLNFMTLNCNVILTPDFMNLCPNVRDLTLGNKVMVENSSLNYRLNNLTISVQGDKFKDLFTTLPISLNLVLNDFYYSDLKVIPENYFEGCSSITNIEVTGNFNKIKKDAFSGCKGLKELHIKANVSEMEAPIIGANAYSLATITLPFIGTTSNNPINYLDLNLSGGFTKKLSIVSPYAVTLNKECFKGATLLKTLEIERGITSESIGCLKGSKIDNLYIGSNFGNNLIDLFEVPTTINNLRLYSLNGKAEFFNGVKITNLFIENSNISNETFTIEDQITYIYLASSTFGSGYESKLDEMASLSHIYYQKANVIYPYINKGYTVGFDYYQAVNSLFN